MERGTDFDATAADYLEYVDGDNGEGNVPIKTETRIVGEVTVREFPSRSWSPQYIRVLEGQPQQIAGSLPQRTRLVIRPFGTDIVYLSATKESCVPDSGNAMWADSDHPVEMFHTAAVWAVADTGAPVDISIFSEFRDGGTG